MAIDERHGVTTADEFCCAGQPPSPRSDHHTLHSIARPKLVEDLIQSAPATIGAPPIQPLAPSPRRNRHFRNDIASSQAVNTNIIVKARLLRRFSLCLLRNCMDSAENT